MNLPNLENCTIGIIGLGYVGLPLCVEFSDVKKCVKTNNPINRKVIGFDVDLLRLKELKECLDRTNEVNEDIDYKDLMTRLKEIKSTIALLKKTIFK